MNDPPNTTHQDGWFARHFPNVSRHWIILKSSWADQNVRDANARPQTDHEFLPAALEIIEKPASPGLRWLMLILCSLFAIAILWSFIGRVDVVATANGKVIPSGNTKTIQPIEIGSVRAIHVRNGQRVTKGQLLVELDPTISSAEEDQSTQQLLSADIIAARNAALLAHLAGRPARFIAPKGTPATIAATQDQFVRASIAEYEAEKASLLQSRAERQAELAATSAEIAKLEQVLPLLERQLAARQELTDKGYFSKLKLLEYEQLRVEHIQNIAIQQANASRSGAAIRNLDAQLLKQREGFARSAVTEQADAQDRSAMAGAEIRKNVRRRELQQIRAPVDGIVQQLTLTTIGGVVQPAEPIMVIVPCQMQPRQRQRATQTCTTDEVEVSAQILNKDIGFIYPGQPVRIKLEAFNFTDYGLIEGVVDNISRDAIQDEKLGLVYSARIKMRRKYLTINGVRTAIGPGLAVQAEIKTGERRIIDYLLSPLARTLDEAGRER